LLFPSQTVFAFIVGAEHGDKGGVGVGVGVAGGQLMLQAGWESEYSQADMQGEPTATLTLPLQSVLSVASVIVLELPLGLKSYSGLLQEAPCAP
jgi:hypothetical protein